MFAAELIYNNIIIIYIIVVPSVYFRPLSRGVSYTFKGNAIIGVNNEGN